MLHDTTKDTWHDAWESKKDYDNNIARNGITFAKETPDNILTYVMDHCDREAQDSNNRDVNFKNQNRMFRMLTALELTRSNQPNCNSRKDEISRGVMMEYLRTKEKYTDAAKRDVFKLLTAADTLHIINSIVEKKGIGGTFDSS